MTQNRETLKRCSVFDGISNDVLDTLANLAKPRTYSAGEVIFVELSEGSEIYLIVEGEVSVQLALANADQGFDIMTLGTGEILGEISFIEEGRRTTTVTALVETKVLEWPCQALRQICEQDDATGYVLVMAVAKLLCQRLRRMNEKIFDNTAWGLE